MFKLIKWRRIEAKNSLQEVQELYHHTNTLLADMLEYMETEDKWVWDKANGSAFGVKAAALHLLQDWRKAQESEVKHQSARNQIADKKWNKPPDDWIKINVNATRAQNGYIGFGCVVRNSQGQFIGARCGRIRGNWSSKEADALSLKEAIIWIKHLQPDCCIFLTDSQSLAYACYGERMVVLISTLLWVIVYLC